MMDLLIVYLLGIFFFVFVGYSQLTSVPNNNRRFDILILFIVFFLFVGRILELIFVADFASVGWSLFPVVEENFEIIFFSKFPWLFFNFSQIVFNFAWVITRFLGALILIRAVFKFEVGEYKGARSVLFYNCLLVSSFLGFWINQSAETSVFTFFLYNLIVSALVYIAFLFFKYSKKIFLSISWGAIGLLINSIYFVFFSDNAQLSTIVLTEIFAALVIIFLEYYRKIFPHKKSSIITSRTEQVHRLYEKRDAKPFYKRNLINEINSKYRKN